MTHFTGLRLLWLNLRSQWLYDVTLGISAISDVGTAALLSAYLSEKQKVVPNVSAFRARTQQVFNFKFQSRDDVFHCHSVRRERLLDNEVCSLQQM